MVTGPFTRSRLLGLPAAANYYKASSWLNQTPPYRLRLRYSMTEARVLPASSAGQWFSADNRVPREWGSSAECYNRAYGKFVEHLRSTSSMGQNFAEREQAVSMIAKRAIQIRRFLRALKSGHFGVAADTLGISEASRPRNVRNVASALGNNFLEYHFGWSPLVDDIGNAIKVLNREFLNDTIHGKASINYQGTRENAGPFWWREVYSYTAKVHIVANYSVSNPDVLLLNQMGFINPIGLAWELVPWSFVVDWFSNVGQVLNSITDFAGVNLVDPAYSTLETCTVDYTDFLGVKSKLVAVEMQRYSGIPGPTLLLPPFRGLSMTRALTAISLLVKDLHG